MTWQSGRGAYEEERRVDPATLSNLSLLGWLGANRFYIGHEVLGALYFALLVVGIVFTIYLPIPVTIKSFTFNLGLLIVIAPFVISLIEFLHFRRLTQGEIDRRYAHPTGGNQALVHVAQIIFLVVLLIPFIARLFSE